MKLLSLVLLSSTLTGNFGDIYGIIIPPIPPVIRTFEDDCLNYGIDVNSVWRPYKPNTNPLTFVTESFSKTDGKNDILQYRTDVQHIVLKHSDYNVYTYLCRVVVNPICKQRHWGFLGIGSHSDDWYFRKLKIYCDYDETISIGQWSPTTYPTPIDDTIIVTIGLNDAAVSASIQYESHLDVVSRTNIAIAKFETEFSYNLLDNYSNNSIVFYTMFRFTASSFFDLRDFPQIHFETIYFGKHWFGNHVETFYLLPYVVDLEHHPFF